EIARRGIDPPSEQDTNPEQASSNDTAEVTNQADEGEQQRVNVGEHWGGVSAHSFPPAPEKRRVSGPWMSSSATGRKAPPQVGAPPNRRTHRPRTRRRRTRSGLPRQIRRPFPPSRRNRQRRAQRRPRRIP